MRAIIGGLAYLAVIVIAVLLLLPWKKKGSKEQNSKIK